MEQNSNSQKSVGHFDQHCKYLIIILGRIRDDQKIITNKQKKIAHMKTILPAKCPKGYMKVIGGCPPLM